MYNSYTFFAISHINEDDIWIPIKGEFLYFEYEIASDFLILSLPIRYPIKNNNHPGS